MKTYLAIFTGSPDSPNNVKWKALDDATRKKKEAAGMAAWGNWAAKNQKSILEMGGPCGKTKKIDASGISDIRNQIAAFTVVQAESYDEAAKLFLDHPHFAIFPGDSVEVMEILPIPGR